MRRFVYALVALTAFAGQASANQCLDVRDVQSYSQGGRHWMKATTDKNQVFRVTFKGLCPYHLNSHFVYQQWQFGRCLKAGDALQIAGGGACVIAETQEIPSNLPRGTGPADQPPTY